MTRCDYKNPVKIMVEKKEWPSLYGPRQAGGGDGVVTERPYAARSTVMEQCSFALTAQGKTGVCVEVDKIEWPNGASKDGYTMAQEGDGVKVYPDPSRENSGGTVQRDSTNALNTYEGCGSGTPVSDGQNLRIRYLTPRECLRLQAFPDDAIDRLEKVLSKSALYKVAGNSIAVCCLKAIFKGIYIDRTFRKDKQSSLDRFF